eukprot:TRINITY_DN1946_c0_g1_i1.p1 TRINITY_DN1946_c0_g1~~TRINITY_DN1946_c0_g1_i1.p1  ORF type:complete len:336 (-),score=65.13 TRINITY_DN1946_c0_g1_i1:12-1019(-)
MEKKQGNLVLTTGTSSRVGGVGSGVGGGVSHDHQGEENLLHQQRNHNNNNKEENEPQRRVERFTPKHSDSESTSEQQQRTHTPPASTKRKLVPEIAKVLTTPDLTTTAPDQGTPPTKRLRTTLVAEPTKQTKTTEVSTDTTVVESQTTATEEEEEVVTNTLLITNFVRPFTLPAVRDYLGQHGRIVTFWIDAIKTHCYVTYEHVAEAVATRKVVDGVIWPPQNTSRPLRAEFVASDANPGKPTNEEASATITLSSGRTVTRDPARNTRTTNLLKPVPCSKPQPSLEQLFQKTKCKPAIYYLPLTDEQIARKKVATGSMGRADASSPPSQQTASST